MATIKFLKSKPDIEVEVGANLMQSLLKAGVPVASSCNGDGVCGKCKVRLIKGLSNLNMENETEAFLKSKESLPKDVRISCQTRVMGDIIIDASYW